MTEILLLFFVFIGELGLAAIVYLASAITPKFALAVFFSVYFLQFITSSVQGGISDYSLRKKSLLIAFNAVLIGQLFFLLAFKNDFMLVGAIFFYGVFGNITPIARAALADTELQNDFRFSIGLSSIAIALGWAFMAFASYYVEPFIICILVTALCFACNFLVRYIKDPEDKIIQKSFSIKDEVAVIRSLFKHSEIVWGLLGYFMVEIAFYQIFASNKGLVDDPLVRFIVITWVFGYILGVILQQYIFCEDKKNAGVIWGTFISIFSMIFLIIFTIFHIESKLFFTFINILYSLGFGFFIPCIFSIVSQRYELHLQGKIYVLVDAVDSLALIIAVAVTHIPWNISLLALFISSLILTVAAMFCFWITIKHSGRITP